MKKKMMALCLALIMTALPLLGLAEDDYRSAATVEGAIFGGQTGDKIAVEINFDFDWITQADNTAYNPDLAAFCALLSSDVYFRTKDVAKGTQNRVLLDGASADDYDWTKLLYAAGFSDVRYIESFREGTYENDTNDSVTLLLAYKKVEEKYDAFVAVLRGCFSVQEWVSVFDPGCEGEAYTTLTGEHPEWKNPGYFKGLDIGMNRAEAFIRAFISEHDDPTATNCILFTGHSRGGALANMLGAIYEKDDSIKTYTYTFNAAAVALDADAAACQTIFNVFDANDFYTNCMPFVEESFLRYGTDLSLNIAESDEIVAEIAALKGRDDYAAPSEEMRSAYQELFGQRFPSRASLYEMTSAVQTFDAREDAEARLAECEALISAETGFGLEQFCSMGEITETADGKYELAMEYCSAALLKAYAMELAYGATAYEGTVSLFAQDDLGCQIADLLMDNAAVLSGGHLLVNSYVLSQYVQ